jgi:hypothetical protein
MVLAEGKLVCASRSAQSKAQATGVLPFYDIIDLKNANYSMWFMLHTINSFDFRLK